MRHFTYANQNVGEGGFMALKLDISKAYNRVQWDFLEELMRMMGFDCKWVRFIMNCVRTVNYVVIVNVEPVM